MSHGCLPFCTHLLVLTVFNRLLYQAQLHQLVHALIATKPWRPEPQLTHSLPLTPRFCCPIAISEVQFRKLSTCTNHITHENWSNTQIVYCNCPGICDHPRSCLCTWIVLLNDVEAIIRLSFLSLKIIPGYCHLFLPDLSICCSLMHWEMHRAPPPPYSILKQRRHHLLFLQNIEAGGTDLTNC